MLFPEVQPRTWKAICEVHELLKEATGLKSKSGFFFFFFMTILPQGILVIAFLLPCWAYSLLNAPFMK